MMQVKVVRDDTVTTGSKLYQKLTDFNQRIVKKNSRLEMHVVTIRFNNTIVQPAAVKWIIENITAVLGAQRVQNKRNNEVYLLIAGHNPNDVSKKRHEALEIITKALPDVA